MQFENGSIEMCFWSVFCKFLGLTIHRKGIYFDPAKAKSIQDM